MKRICENFDLEYQFKYYLKNVGLDEDLLSPIQKTEIKQAFYAGCLQMHALTYTLINFESEEEFMKNWDSIYDQIKQYFESRIG